MNNKDDADLMEKLLEDADFLDFLKKWKLNFSCTQCYKGELGIETTTKSGNIVAIYPKSKRVEVRETDKLWEITGKYFQ